MIKKDVERLQKLNTRDIKLLAKKAIVTENEGKINHLVKILIMRRKGDSYRKIANALNVKSQETVRYWLSKINKIADNE